MDTSVPDGSVLAVFAHPDDESLSAGGLLAAAAERGARTGVLTPTWAADSHRADELAAAAKALGAQEVHLLGWADSRVPDSAPGRPRWCDVSVAEAVGAVVAHLREFRPDVVVTHDAYGGATGHEDHVQTHRITALAVEAAGLADSYPDAGAPWHVREVWLSTHPDSTREDLGALFDRRPVFTLPDDATTHRLDVTPWLDAKVEAVLAHTSEVERGSLPAVVARMSATERAQLLGTEWYVARSG